MENDENAGDGRSVIERLAKVDRECIAFRNRIDNAEQHLMGYRERLAEWIELRIDLIGQLALQEGIGPPVQEPKSPGE